MLLRLPEPDDGIQAIVKLVGEACNIDCVYCYEKRKPYSSKGFLDSSVLDDFLRLCRGRPLSLLLHGGEPLLSGRRRMSEYLDVIRNYSGPVNLSIQTNGLLLDDHWLNFFEEEWPNIAFGISLDGDRAGNAFRVDYAGRPTFDKVTAALQRLSQRGHTVGVILVVTPAILGRATAVIEQMREFAAVKSLKLSSCFDYAIPGAAVAGPGMTPAWATTPQQYSDFVLECFDHWRGSGAYDSFLLEPAVSVMRSLFGHPGGFTHWSSKKCPFVVTLYPDGRLGGADELPMPDAYYGMVQELTDLQHVLHLGTNPGLKDDLISLLQECSGCSVEDVCLGGAPAERRRYQGTSLAAEYCDARRDLVSHIGRGLVE